MRSHNVPRTIAATAAAIAVGVGAVGAAQRGNSAPTHEEPAVTHTTPAAPGGHPEDWPMLSGKAEEAAIAEAERRQDDSYKEKMDYLSPKYRNELAEGWAEEAAETQAEAAGWRNPEHYDTWSPSEKKGWDKVAEEQLADEEARQAHQNQHKVEGFTPDQQMDIDRAVRDQVDREHMTPEQRQAYDKKIAEIHKLMAEERVIK